MHSIKGLFAVLAIMAVAMATTPSVKADGQMQGHAGTSMPDHGGMMPPAPDAHPFEKQMYADMNKMMLDMHAPGYTGNWDVDFMAMMIPHHQGAIDMAVLVIEHGEDPEVRRLAEEIIAAQRREIAFMTRHIEALQKGMAGDHGSHGEAKH